MKFLAPLLAVLIWVTPALAQERPIFDTHVHYSHGAWDIYSPAQILAKLDKAGVSRALF